MKKERYTPDWDFVSGSFNSGFKMLANSKHKYKEVTLNLTAQPKNGNHGWNYAIAEVKLHNGTLNSAEKTFEDATKLAEQIAKRWNTYPILIDLIQKMSAKFLLTGKDLEIWNNDIDKTDIENLIDNLQKRFNSETEEDKNSRTIPE